MGAMPVTLIPTRLDQTATRETEVTDTRRRAIWRGSSYEDTGVIADGDGNPIKLGPPDAPLWEFVAQVRDGKAQEGGRVLCEFTVEIVNDGDDGLVRWKLEPSDSASVIEDFAVWDFDAINVSSLEYPVGYRPTVWSGQTRFLGHVSSEADS